MSFTVTEPPFLVQGSRRAEADQVLRQEHAREDARPLHSGCTDARKDRTEGRNGRTERNGRNGRTERKNETEGRNGETEWKDGTEERNGRTERKDEGKERKEGRTQHFVSLSFIGIPIRFTWKLRFSIDTYQQCLPMLNHYI